MTNREVQNVFDFRNEVVSDYSRFSRSIATIRAKDIQTFVDNEYAQARYWPESLADNPGIISRFWLLHEWVHALAPDMPTSEAEALADLIPAELLYPEVEALRFLKGRSFREPISHWITSIQSEAQRLEISAICVWKQLVVVSENGS